MSAEEIGDVGGVVVKNNKEEGLTLLMISLFM